jgi:adenine-specific DNA methylase
MEFIKYIIDNWEIIPFSTIFGFLIFLYKKNQSYKKVISDFYELLPQRNKKATEIKSTWFPFRVFNLSTHNPSISQNQIDSFFNRINNFDYKFVIFNKYYKSYTKNLNRFDNAKSTPGNNDLFMIQEIIEQSIIDGKMPIDFIKIIWYKLAIKVRFIGLKYKFKKWLK